MQRYDYSAIHIHSSSFHILEDILSIQALKVIEINKDIGGLTVKQMLPYFKKVVSAGKLLLIWGGLYEHDIELIKTDLPDRGVFFNIVAENKGYANSLKELL